ncbi:MAG: mechanosensitive ion channel, partial [Calditrichia bacterium]|nr:mechanosensitive ion channel [Calditrichia bacterium]
WITVPQFGADGDVLDIALHTVKIQNWDKTITVIPTHKLLDVTFKNWSGMVQSGGRRIKRAINIDLNSIKFCNNEMIENYGEMPLLKDYISEKKQNITESGGHKKITNVGTFRKYIELYIKNHTKIHQDLIVLIRQLASGPQGLPLEIYAFTNTTEWIEYEKIQGDIFDHLIAVLPKFDLEVFQNPSRSDFAQLGNVMRGE